MKQDHVYREAVARELLALAKDVMDGVAPITDVIIEYHGYSSAQGRPFPVCTAAGRSRKNMRFSVEFEVEK